MIKVFFENKSLTVFPVHHPLFRKTQGGAHHVMGNSGNSFLPFPLHRHGIE